MSVATIYKYFKNKQELFESLNSLGLMSLRPQYEKKREEIVRTALTFFGTRGLIGTSLDDVTKACGFSKANLYQYFSSKEDLFRAVFQYGKVLPQLSKMETSDHEDVKKALTDLAESFLATLTEPERLSLLRLTIAESSRFPEIGKLLYDHAISKATEQLANYLWQHQVEGRPRLPRETLNKIPKFVPKSAILKIEEYARKHQLDTVTPEVMEKARRKTTLS